MSLVTAFMMEVVEESSLETQVKSQKCKETCNNSIDSYEDIMEWIEHEHPIPLLEPQNEPKDERTS